MNSRLKLSILIATTCFVVAGAIGIIAWAIAAANIGVSSKLSVTYTASQNVVCEASATYQKTTDTTATAFQSGKLNFAYGSSTTSQTMTASSSAVVLNDTNTYVIFEYTFKNKNLMKDYRLRVQLTDNANCTNMTRKYYIGDLSSLTVAQKRDKIRESNITNDSLKSSASPFFTLGYQETGRMYMLLEITPGVMANYSTSSSHLFTFALTTTDGYAITCDPNGGYRNENGATYTESWKKTKGASEPFGARSRNGYTLKGYILKNTHTGSTTDVGGATFTFNSSTKGGTYVQGTVDCTLVAQWQANQYTITTNLNGGTLDGKTGNLTTKLYTDESMPFGIPTRAGYTFAGWTFSGGTVNSGANYNAFGKELNSNPAFNGTSSGVSVYNNKGNGTVTHAVVQGSAPNNTGYYLEITTAGEASPGVGGYYHGTASYANAVFTTVIIAKIPTGYNIQWTSNATGDSRTAEWLTGQAGTGTWQRYIYKIKCGASGSFSLTNFYYLTGTEGTAEKPVKWQVAYSQVFDSTGLTANDSNTAKFLTCTGGANITATANWTAN